MRRKNFKRKAGDSSRTYLLFFVLACLIGVFVYQQSRTLFLYKAQAQIASDTQAPSAPANLKVSGNLASSRSEGSWDDLTWDASTDNVGVTSYVIYQIVSGIYDPNPIATVNTTSYTRKFVVSGYATDYYYYVVAKDAAGNVSLKSNIAHMTGIWGDVLDASNYRYIRGSVIQVKGNNVNKSYTANYGGAYLLNIPEGTYTATYSAQGYVTQTYTLVVSSNAMTSRNVFLVKQTKK